MDWVHGEPELDLRLERLNAAEWSRPSNVKRYAHRRLRPVEVMLLLRHRDALSGRVLELGSAAGRLTGYLVELAHAVHGIDMSPSMVDYCRRTYPRGTYSHGDLSDLGVLSGPFDVVWAPYNSLDFLGDAKRHRALTEVAGLLSPDGVFIMSSHNRGYAPLRQGPLKVLPLRTPVRIAGKIALAPWRLHNQRRCRLLEHEDGEHAILNDEAHDFRLLHYYITRDAQARQLKACGLRLLECLDADLRPVEAGDSAPQCPELHYVAQRSRRPRGDPAAPIRSPPVTLRGCQSHGDVR